MISSQLPVPQPLVTVTPHLPSPATTEQQVTEAGTDCGTVTGVALVWCVTRVCVCGIGCMLCL